MFDKSQLEGAATDEGFTLKVDHFVPAAGYSSEMAISGKPDGEGLTGEASWDAYGYDVYGEARRISPPKGELRFASFLQQRLSACRRNAASSDAAS